MSHRAFIRHHIHAPGRGAVELIMAWPQSAERSSVALVEQVLVALRPAIVAGDIGHARVAVGERKGRKAKLSVAKVLAALEGSRFTQIQLLGSRGHVSLVFGGNVAPYLDVTLETDPYDLDTERHDGLALAAVFDELLNTTPERGHVHPTIECAAALALDQREPDAGASFHALHDVAWRQLVDPAHRLALAPLRDTGLVSIWGQQIGIALPGDVGDVLGLDARRARVRLVAAVDPVRAASYDNALAARADVVAPMEVELDADAAPLMVAAIQRDAAPYAQVTALRWASRALAVDERAPASSVSGTRSRTLPRVLEPLGAEALALLHAEALPNVMPPSLEGLVEVDLLACSFGITRMGRLFMFEADVEHHLVPALGAYLGELMVGALDGEWVVPAESDRERDDTIVADWPISRVESHDCDRIAVVVGATAWFSFARARHLVQAVTSQGFNPSRDPVLEKSLTKMFGAARRDAAGLQVPEPFETRTGPARAQAQEEETQGRRSGRRR